LFGDDFEIIQPICAHRETEPRLPEVETIAHRLPDVSKYRVHHPKLRSQCPARSRSVGPEYGFHHAGIRTIFRASSEIAVAIRWITGAKIGNLTASAVLAAGHQHVLIRGDRLHDFIHEISPRLGSLLSREVPSSL